MGEYPAHRPNRFARESGLRRRHQVVSGILHRPQRAPGLDRAPGTRPPREPHLHHPLVLPDHPVDFGRARRMTGRSRRRDLKKFSSSWQLFGRRPVRLNMFDMYSEKSSPLAGCPSRRHVPSIPLPSFPREFGPTVNVINRPTYKRRG